VLLCFIDPRVRKIRNEASSCPGIISRTLRFHYVASSSGSLLPHLLDGHRKLVQRTIPTGPVRGRLCSNLAERAAYACLLNKFKSFVYLSVNGSVDLWIEVTEVGDDWKACAQSGGIVRG